MTGILAKIGGMELAGQPALTRWGTALAHFVWQGAVLAVVAWALMSLVKRATPQVRYAALVVLLALMAACPVATFWLIGADAGPDLPGDIAIIGMTQPSEYESGGEFTKPDDRPHVAPDFTSDGATPPKPVVDSEARTGDSPAWVALVRQSGARLQAQAHWLVLAWCGGVVVLSIRLVAGIIGLELVKRRGARPAAAIEATVAVLARRLRVSQPVRVLESAAAEVPAVVGWLRPYILLPASAMTGLTTAELEAVLAHELAHVRRHDYLVNVVQIVIETLLFYHPAVWWLSGRIRREREHCCDDWAVKVCGNRVTYARALVALEGLRGPASGLALAVSGGSLRDRVLRLVGRPTPRCRNRSGWFAAALVVLVVAAAAGIGAAVTTRAEEPGPSKENAAVRGRVLDHAGKPVVGAAVFPLGERALWIGGRRAVKRAGPLEPTEDTSFERALTDSEGRFALAGQGGEVRRLAVSCSKLDAWVVPLEQDADQSNVVIRLPEPGRLVVRYDIDGAAPEARLILQIRTSAMSGWEGVESIREPNVPNQGEVALNNLPPGKYELSRQKRDEHGIHGTFLCDRRTITIESGRTVTSDFVRDRGAPVVGNLALPQDAQIESTVVMVRPAEASGDPESPDDSKLPVFDALVCGADGKFETERLLPGEYAIIAHAYAPETADERHSTGVRSPRFVGRATLTVGEVGPPPEVRIELRDRDLREPDARTAWGEARDGLRVGLTFADRTRKRYKVGEVVPMELVAQNVSDKPIFCTYALWPYFSDHPLEIRDEDDTDITLPKTTISKGALSNTKRIEPGVIVLLAQRNVEFRSAAEGPKEGVRYWVVGGPGKYRLSQEVALSTERKKVSELHPMDTDMETYRSGQLVLELAEATATEAGTRGEPAKKTRLALRARSGSDLLLKTRTIEQPNASARVVTEVVARSATIVVTEPYGRNLTIEAIKISLVLGADVEIALLDGNLHASFSEGSVVKVKCQGDVQFKRGRTLLKANRMTLDLRHRRFAAEGHRPPGEGEIDQIEGSIDDVLPGDQADGMTETVAAHKLSAATWGEVRDGWQVGVRWKSGRVEHEVGTDAWYEVVARNPGERPVTVPVTQGQHSDVTLDAGNELYIRIHGVDLQKLALAAGEERVLDVWRSRLSTVGLPTGEYTVKIRTPVADDVPQPPPLGLRLTAASKPGEPDVPHDFKASAVPADDKPVNNPETIVWGEPVLGLQAGVRFAAAVPRRKLGKTIETEVFLCNTNSHNVEIEYLHHTPLDFAPQVRDGDGREIQALLMVSGPKFNESRILAPNEPVLIGKSQFWVHSPKGGSREFPSVVAPPGKYHYSTGLHIGRTNLNYVGIQVTTGELTLELVAADDGDGTATEVIDGKADGPAKTVFAFLEAVRNGNGTEANAMLTQRAREKTAELDMFVAPPGSKTASFKVGRAKIVTSEHGKGTRELAQVASTWTDIKEDGERHIDWSLKLEPEGWRIYGMATKIFKDQPPMVLNFEDPQSMQRNQQEAEAEMERRAKRDDRNLTVPAPADESGGAAPERIDGIHRAVERGVEFLKRKQEIGRAVQRGVDYLKSQQNAQSGGWEDIAGFPGGVSALCALALLKSGVAPDDPAIEKALGRLRSLGEPKKTYSTALDTLVYCAADPARDRALIERNVKWLEQVQKRKGHMAGAWAYPESEGDNSNTGFAVMAMYEAEQAGIKAAPETWRRVLDYWVSTQNADGSWGYKPGLPGNGSMTCSGASSLAAAAEVLGENDPAGAARQALARALNWMGGRFSVQANPGAKGKGWLLYYFNGVERVGRLTKEQLIGEHDWYREGTALLVEAQDTLTGSWKGQGHTEEHPHIGTSFALLFLANGGKEKK